MIKKSILLLLTLLLSMSSTFAAGYFDGKWYNPVLYIEWTAIFIALLTVILLFLPKKMEEHHKKFFFYLFSIPVLLSTVYLGGATVYENIISETGGPVHWHADYQVWYCGERLDLIDPKFPSNKIGSPLFHEHNDDRMHVEGTVHKISSVSLGSYFKVLGGKLSETEGLVYPTNDGRIIRHGPGDTCPNGEQAVLNVYINGERTDEFEDYIIYPHALVPPGDCIIYEVGPFSETTDKICESWEANTWGYDNWQQKRAEY